jgi:hypothetical protein
MDINAILAKKGLLLTPGLEAAIAADIENRVAGLYSQLTNPKQRRGRKKGSLNDSVKES